jgi:hypothetical protein
MKDLKGISLRRAVARRLDGIFAEWIKHLGAGTGRIWAQVERSLGHPRETGDTAPADAGEPADPASPVMRAPMQQGPPQQQPVQQQQKKKET